MTEKGLGQLDLLNEHTVHARMRRIVGDMNDTAPFDLVCIVVGGQGRFRSGSLVKKVEKGALVFVPKDSVYGWFDVKKPIDVMEWSSTGEMKSMNASTASRKPAEPAPATFTLEGVGRERLPGGNTWNAFIRRPSMVFGLYMLPKSVGGDSALTHRWDEINLITAGTGKFQVGSDIMEVRPGDIIYVRKGNPHFFHSLNEDLDILIFFEMASMAGM
jgi:mannose-6-phosphate isomerase-like protein (cupin superfamily)